MKKPPPQAARNAVRNKLTAPVSSRRMQARRRRCPSALEEHAARLPSKELPAPTRPILTPDAGTRLPALLTAEAEFPDCPVLQNLLWHCTPLRFHAWGRPGWSRADVTGRKFHFVWNVIIAPLALIFKLCASRRSCAQAQIVLTFSVCAKSYSRDLASLAAEGRKGRSKSPGF